MGRMRRAAVEATTIPEDPKDRIPSNLLDFDLPIIVQPWDRIRMLEAILDCQKLTRKYLHTKYDFKDEHAAELLERLGYLRGILEDT